jgi:KDO2-lipid IV(A) lauroyltransferase
VATAPATLGGVRQMIRALRHGRAVGLLPDQVPPLGMGVWVPFFGRPAYTMTLAARLVQQTGAVPLLIWGERLAGGAGYMVRVSELPEPLPAIDPTQAESAAVINRAMECLIRQCPGQYLWGYNRYKQPRAAETNA